MTSRDEAMNEMWEALEKYQPYADKRGFGDAWRRMTTERTEDSVWKAFWSARVPVWAARAVGAVLDAAWAEEYATDAIRYINYAIAEENK